MSARDVARGVTRRAGTSDEGPRGYRIAGRMGIPSLQEVATPRIETVTTRPHRLTMILKQALAQPKALGNESVRAHDSRNEAGYDQYGSNSATFGS